jgi:outer membrane lipoprotein carrier protein
MVLCSSLVVAAGGRAGGLQDAHAIVHAFESRYRGARTLQATFLERYSENGRVVRSEAGTAYFRKPGRMRWDYEAPENNLFLVDGKTAWFYVPADHTVTRVPAKQSGDVRTPLALLAGEVKVSRICSRVAIVSSPEPLAAGDVMLRCLLKGEREETADGVMAPGLSPPDATLRGGALRAKAKPIHYNRPATPSAERQAFFEIAPANGELARVIVRDPGGVGIEYRFKNWSFNPPLPDSMFRFEPPAGVAIVNGELPESGAVQRP